MVKEGKRMKSIIKKIAAVGLGLIILALLLILFIPARTPSIKDNRGKIVEGSVAQLKSLNLGGVEQHILVRGVDKDNPILLFLHGGPGHAQIGYARKYQSQLEESFVVVNWDQRGSGKSYSPGIPKDTMNREQFIADAKELMDYLCQEFDEDKIYLAGHSWGSELGLFLADRFPEKIAAYIGIGQVIDGTKNETVSYDYVMDMARRDNNQKAIEALEEIGRPPYKNVVKDTTTQRKWLARYGGVERKVNTLRDIIWSSIFSPEYTGLDGIKFAIGNKFTAEAMWGDNEDLNFIEEVTVLKVPVYFVAGRYDYNTPSGLVEEYYNNITAPKKDFIWFENSAHFPHFEEPQKFQEVMEIIKRENP